MSKFKIGQPMDLRIKGQQVDAQIKSDDGRVLVIEIKGQEDLILFRKPVKKQPTP